MRQVVLHVAMACLVLSGCSSNSSAPDVQSLDAKVVVVEKKIDDLLSKLNGAHQTPPSDKSSAVNIESLDAKVAVIEKKIDELLSKISKAHEAPPSDGPNKLEQVVAKLDELLSRVPKPALGIDTSKLSRTSTSDLAWFLITNDPKEKKELALRRVEQSSQHKEVTRESIVELVNDLEALNVILNAPELLEADVLQQVEDARNRLVELLRKEIPTVVRNLDEQAVKSSDYAESKRLWAESSAVLGFYPSSNDPIEAGRIQEMVSEHDLVRARIELLQQQRYNLWACQQIRKAWKDFEENSDEGARMQTCLHFLGPIHPGLLDPVTLELYRDFLQTVRNKLSQELYEKLSEQLAVEKRKLLTDL